MDYPQAVVSILILCISVLIGLPVWWHTTKVYRAELPHQQIALLRSTRINIKIKVDIAISSDFDINTDVLKDALRKKFTHNDVWNVDLEIKRMRLDRDVEQYCNKIEPTKNGGLLYQIFVVKDNTLSAAKYSICSQELGVVIYTGNNTSIPDIVYLPIEKYVFHSDIKTNMQVDEQNSERTLSPSAKYRIDFTLAVADPNDYMLTWDIKTAIEERFMPVLKQIDFLGPFSISSQVLYFADLTLKPFQYNDGYFYTKPKLSLLINSLESRLNTYTSTDVGLNFVVYVPPKQYTPLVIKSKKTDSAYHTAFHSARWGGIQLFSPQNTSSHVPIAELMDTFVEQLKFLVGIVELNSAIGITTWASMRLRFERTCEHLQKSISTLSSLSTLLDSIANIVIRDDIKILIDQSVTNIEKSKHFLSSGNILEAYKHSKIAYLSSEKAFYDSSLLALLYFPDDQKYAIYVPLFLPIALPIFMSFFKTVRWLRQQKIDAKEKLE